MSQNEGHSAPKKTGYEAANDIREHEGSAFTVDVHDTKFSGNDTGICPHCGQALESSDLEQLLGRLGITQEMLSNLKDQFQNVDVDEYLTTARESLKRSGNDLQLYVKENPAKVAAGVAALALGAGLVWSSFAHQADTEELEDRVRQLELRIALAGPKYRLDEVLSELGVAV
jgi:hypothetical protein